MQLNVMPLSELLTTANNYATSIKELGIYSDLVKELCNRLDAGSLAMREMTQQRDELLAVLRERAEPFGYYSPEVPTILEQQGHANIRRECAGEYRLPLYAAAPAPGKEG